MTEPSLALQAAVIAKLLQSEPLKALINDRIFDRVPDGATMPYVTYGDDGINDDSFDCTVGSEIFINLTVWSKAYGRVEVKQIAGMIRNILDDEDLSLTDHMLVSLLHRITRIIPQEGGLIHSAPVTFRALVEEGLTITG